MGLDCVCNEWAKHCSSGLKNVLKGQAIVKTLIKLFRAVVLPSVKFKYNICYDARAVRLLRAARVARILLVRVQRHYCVPRV